MKNPVCYSLPPATGIGWKKNVWLFWQLFIPKISLFIALRPREHLKILKRWHSKCSRSRCQVIWNTRDHSGARRRHSTVDSNDKWFYVSKTNCLICFDVWINSYQMIYTKKLSLLVINVKWLGFQFPSWVGTCAYPPWPDVTCTVYLTLWQLVITWIQILKWYSGHCFRMIYHHLFGTFFCGTRRIEWFWRLAWGTLHVVLGMDNWHLFYEHRFAWEKAVLLRLLLAARLKLSKLKYTMNSGLKIHVYNFISLASMSYFVITKCTYQNRKLFLHAKII